MAFNRGAHTLHVSAKLFAENRQRLIAAIKSKVGKKSFIVLQGGAETTRYHTDANDLPFRQESYFFWAFGVQESDCFAAIDIDTGKSILFPPKLAPEYSVWLGKINPENWFAEKYEVDEVHFDSENVIEEVLTRHGAENLYLLKAFCEDSGHWLEPSKKLTNLSKFKVDLETLYPVFAECRVTKTDLELDVMRYATKIATDAHKEVMRKIKPEMYEYQMESLFRHVSYFTGGCRHLAYTCIAATGENGAVLHYGHANAPNEKLIKNGDMCLFDMGPEYNCYASDVTCSFPCNGKFTEKQKVVYNAVLAASRAVSENARPGVRWTDMHLLAERKILEHLKEAGIVVGDVDEMLKKRMGAIFMPHGLGHLIGLDVHDQGGYLGDAIPRIKEPGLKSLRTTRTLKERMAITIEPGCYFIDTLLDQALNDDKLKGFLNKDVLETYRGIGGVRIEDDVVIWKDRVENLSADLPRTVEEIEAFMAKENENLKK
uniref:Aminopeptidase P N-terminal domain-containing protein n=1 Tax=Panagrolaimus sp. JU765 TaxID=591449 RepID=A0AC34QP62_9BILA